MSGLGNSKKLSDLLPVQFTSSTIGLNDDAFDAAAYFLTSCIQKSKVNKAEDFPLPKILTASKDNFFTLLFRLAHRNFADELCGNRKSPAVSFKHSGTELLRFLCTAASQKWVPLFVDEDVLSLAMSCFLIEACMNLDWCPNAFEGRAKRAAHIYFSNLRKSLFRVSNSGFSTIVGYLQAAWLCAQKTEGIKDRIGEWERGDSLLYYSWEMPSNGDKIKSEFTMYKYPRNSFFLMIPKYNSRLPHPFTRLENEQKTGVALSCEDEPIRPSELVEHTPINRHDIQGDRFIYICDISPSQHIKWLVAIQVFHNTIYRIDVIRPDTGNCRISSAEIRIENSIPLSKTSTNIYQGKSHSNAVVELLKNPFSLDYQGQEEKDISLFTGQGLTLSSKTSVEMITAWSIGKNICSIDRTNLLGIFNI